MSCNECSFFAGTRGFGCESQTIKFKKEKFCQLSANVSKAATECCMHKSLDLRGAFFLCQLNFYFYFYHLLENRITSCHTTIACYAVNMCLDVIMVVWSQW